jgi:hypothetical protein
LHQSHCFRCLCHLLIPAVHIHCKHTFSCICKSESMLCAWYDERENDYSIILDYVHHPSLSQLSLFEKWTYFSLSVNRAEKLLCWDSQ